MGQGKFAGQRPAFYHCAMYPTNSQLIEPIQNIDVWNVSHLTVVTTFLPLLTGTLLQLANPGCG